MSDRAGGRGCAARVDPRVTKRYLKALTAVVAAAIYALDAEMKRHSDAERGRRIAHIIGAWLRAARRLMHEEGRVIRGDLKTTEGLLLAARAMIHKLKGPARRVGMPLPDDFDEVVEALDARCAKIRREAAVKSSKTVSRAYWDPGKAGAP